MADDRPIRVIVEVVSSADVKRLDAKDEELREIIKSLERQMEGLHGMMFEMMETLARRGK